MTEDGDVRAVVRYESDYLTMTEVNNLFSVLQQYKGYSLEELQQMAMGMSWQNADAANVMSVIRMAEEMNTPDNLMTLVVAKYKYPIVQPDDE